MDLSTRQGRAEQGRRIQSAAEQAGLSLADLAKRIGCSRALIYQYVSGQVLAQADRLQAVALACGKPLGWFYGEAEEPGGGVREEQLERLRLELEAERMAFERARGRELAEHLAELADAQAGPPDFAALRRTCERLTERARDLGDPELLAEAEFRLGNACYALGDFEATRAAMSRALSGFRELGRPVREAAARQTLGGALAGLGERDRALAEFEAARAAGGFSREWRARVGRADVFEALGRGEEALAELAAAEELLAAEPDAGERTWAELFLAGATANVYLLNDDFLAAAAHARRMVPLAEELACVSQLVEGRLNLGYARRRLGEWPEALACYEDALRLARLTGDRERHATAMACLADLLAALGRFEEALVTGKDALAAALGMGSARGELWAHLALSEAYRRSGNGHEALYHAQQAVAGAAGHSLAKIEATARLAAAKARRQLGEPGPAAADERRAAAVAEAIGARWLAGVAAVGQAEGALAEGRPDLAAEQAAVAARLAAETGEAELALEAELCAVAVAEAQGDSGGAAARLEAAVTVWLERRERLIAGGVDEALWEDVGRLTALRRCVTLLCATGAEGRARELLARVAWPPLLDEFPELAEE